MVLAKFMNRGPVLQTSENATQAAKTARQVIDVLATKNLTLYEVAKRSALRFGRSSRYFIPHNLRFELSRRNFSLSVFQVFALSCISNYRFSDWLRLLGFRIENMAAWQLQLPAARTVLLESLDDPAAAVRWLRARLDGTPIDAVLPFSRAMEWTNARRLGSIEEGSGQQYLYARVGTEDALAFPEVLAGSIVRADSHVTEDLLPEREGEISKRIFLVAQERGLCCCRIRRTAASGIELISDQLPYAEMQFLLPGQASLLGILDMEIRSVTAPIIPQVGPAFAKRWRAQSTGPLVGKLSAILRQSRSRSGSSLRAVSARSARVAELLGDPRYYISPGSLSDYEASDVPPRQIHKLISVSLIYGFPFQRTLRSLDLDLEKAGVESMPNRFARSSADLPVLDDSRFQATKRGDLLEALLGMVREIPFFLRSALPQLSGLSRPSLRDFFWIGGIRNPGHPNLEGGVCVAVNRRRKKLVSSVPRQPWQQPLYLLEKRDGSYLCACCTREEGRLVLHSWEAGMHRIERYPATELGVVGQVTTVVRRLL